MKAPRGVLENPRLGSLALRFTGRPKAKRPRCRQTSGTVFKSRTMTVCSDIGRTIAQSHAA
jgi:hypothetical protein